MSVRIATIQDVHETERIVQQHLSPAPLIRSYPLEKELGLPCNRRVWLKDYGWTPVGSFKLLGRRLVYLASRLEAMPEREGTVLDNSCLFFLSNTWSGSQH